MNNPIKPSFAKTVFLLAFTCLSAAVKGQTFITPLEIGVAPSRHCYVITQNGERIDGKTQFAFTWTRGIRFVSMKLASGESRKFRASELREVGFTNNNLIRVISSVEQVASIRKAVEADWDQIEKQEYIVYNQVTLRSGKHVMMQMINPGFSSKIQVYYSLGSRKTSGIGIPFPVPGPANPTIKLTGGRQRAYWVSKDNGKVIKLKRGNYNKKKFNLLFGDRPEMAQAFGRPYRFKNFEQHVFFYDQLR